MNVFERQAACGGPSCMKPLRVVSLPDPDGEGRGGPASGAGGFDLAYGDRDVYALDKMNGGIKKIWRFEKAKCGERECPYGKRVRGYFQKGFKAVDAFVEGGDGRFYFIEFKDQSLHNVSLLRESIYGKAVESLFSAALSVLARVSLHDICGKAVFLLVYKEDESAAGEGKCACMEPVLDAAGLRGASARQAGILDLDAQLHRRFGLYSDARALTEREFNQYSRVIFETLPDPA